MSVPIFSRAKYFNPGMPTRWRWLSQKPGGFLGSPLFLAINAVNKCLYLNKPLFLAINAVSKCLYLNKPRLNKACVNKANKR